MSRVSLFRMAYEDRFGPAGAVWKFRNGEWDEPGLGGHVTAIYPAQNRGNSQMPILFGGLQFTGTPTSRRYVVLMNHACCEAGWMQEGIYISYISDLADPTKWGTPTKLLDGENIGFRAGFYPQVMGLEEGETDSVSGWYARLYIQGISKWEIIFSH